MERKDPVALLRDEMSRGDADLGRDAPEVRRLMERALEQWQCKREGW